MASCGYFFASLRQRSCSSQCRYRSVHAVTKMHCCSERKTAFVQPFCSARCSANKSLKQRCFNVFCIVRGVIILCSVHTVSCRLHIQMERCAKFLSEDHEPHSGMPVVVQTNKQTTIFIVLLIQKV